jgi:hypothetical protein
MLALSIRQPWADLILRAGKDIENRSWSTRVRGRILIHAAQGMRLGDWREATAFAQRAVPGLPDSLIEEPQALARGGIIGSVEIVDCVAHSESPWYMGQIGFVLRDPRPLPFTPWKGRLGFFEVPEAALQQAKNTS